jgi:hypothetical protein
MKKFSIIFSIKTIKEFELEVDEKLKISIQYENMNKDFVNKNI